MKKVQNFIGSSPNLYLGRVKFQVSNCRTLEFGSVRFVNISAENMLYMNIGT